MTCNNTYICTFSSSQLSNLSSEFCVFYWITLLFIVDVECSHVDLTSENFSDFLSRNFKFSLGFPSQRLKIPTYER